jgi:predicted RNase H-like nuclease
MDGCRAGWVLVTAPAEDDGPSTVAVGRDLTEVIARIDAGDLAAVAIDIPIGLPEREPRPCDLAARKLLGPRASSVFPAPLRCVLGSTTYQDACARSFDQCGKRMSKQAYGILPKIEEVDSVMIPARQHSMVEVHPEVSFAVLAGRPMGHHKSTPEGRAERLNVLRPKFIDLDEHGNTTIRNTNPDDILDAFVAAWSARRWLARTHRQLGGELDSRGLRMEIVA